MGHFTVKRRGNDTVISGITNFNLADTLDCGQAFRWSADSEGRWHGVAHGRSLCIYERGGDIVLADTSEQQFEEIWREYFDLERDYQNIIDRVSTNELLAEIASFGSGIRVLRQELWETLCSFIISQNNNIPRIKGIITRLCDNFGTPAEGGGMAFPDARCIAEKTVDDLAVLRAGFRAKYLIDAAKKLSEGLIDIGTLQTAPIDEARQMLMTVNGVGPKVADCVLLFACGRIDSFPVDVWIRRAMTKLFDGDLPECAVPYAGIVQQYLFHYARMTGLNPE